MNRSLRSDRRPKRNHRPSRAPAEEQHSAIETVVPESRGKRRLWPLGLLLLVCLGGSFGVSFFFFREVAPSIPRELVGTWQVTEGDLKGATLEFNWYGTAIATQYTNGKKGTLESSVKMEGKTILLTAHDPVTGRQETLSQTILKLTDDELVIRDQDKHVYRMVKVRN